MIVSRPMNGSGADSEDVFGRPIRAYMSAPVHAVSIDDSLEDVAAALTEFRVSCLPVLGRDGRAAGVISHSDLLQISHVMARTGGGKDLLTLPAMCAGDLMTRQVVAASPDTPVVEGAAQMMAHGVHRLFVLEDGAPVGVWSAHDVLRALVDSGKKTPIRNYMTSPAITIDIGEPITLAVDRLYGVRAVGLVILDRGLPAGIFTVVEALAARELPRSASVGEGAGYSMISFPEETPIDRAAALAIATRARRVVALGPDGSVAGVLTGLDFARAVSG